MENEDLHYEVKPMPVVVPRGTQPWAGKFVQAMGHVGFRAFVTIVIGGAVVAGVARWGHHPAEPKPFWPYFLEHFFTELAIALFISAIVVFMFEWGSEVKHSLDLAGNLAYSLTNHITRILDASASESIAEAMRQLVGNKNAKDFVDPLRSFAESIKKLGGGGGWAGQSYLQFVAWYHGEITGYAESLAILSEKLTADRKSKAEFRLVLPEATVPIDVMLARITDEMESCGAYFAISDVFTWTKLAEFQAAQQKALDNGLEIRRIFVIGKPSDADVPAKEVSLRMLRHFDDAVLSKECYRIKLISQTNFKRLAARILQETEHFGIFKPSDERKHPIIVQVLDQRLLTFRIAGATEAEAVLAAFEELWKELAAIPECDKPDPIIVDSRSHDKAGTSCDAGEPTTAEPPAAEPKTAELSAAEPKATEPPSEKPPSGREIIRDHVLAYRMRQLPPSLKDGVWYHGASDIELWARGTLREFEQSIVEAAEDGIEIKRLFIFEQTIAFDLENRIFRILRKHAEISRRKPNYQWRVILRELMPPDLRKEPFALFRDGVKAEIEVAYGDKDFHIGVSKAVAVELEEGFEEAWNKFRGPEAPSADEVTVLRHFDDEWRKNLGDGDPLKKYFDDMVASLRDELGKSIKDLFPGDAEKILAFIHPSPERTDHYDDPHDHE